MNTISQQEKKDALEVAIKSLQNMKNVRGFIILAMEEETENCEDVEELEVRGVNAMCGTQNTFNQLLSNLDKRVLNRFSMLRTVESLSKIFKE